MIASSAIISILPLTNGNLFDIMKLLIISVDTQSNMENDNGGMYPLYESVENPTQSGAPSPTHSSSAVYILTDDEVTGAYYNQREGYTDGYTDLIERRNVQDYGYQGYNHGIFLLIFTNIIYIFHNKTTV